MPVIKALLIISLALSFVTFSACQTKQTGPANTAGNTSSTPDAASSEQKVTINSPDGLKLIGTIYRSDKPNSPAVLLLHQWQSDRHSYDEFAKRIQAKGFAVLSIDGRGFGESTKAADGMTVPAERTDAAVKAMLGDVGAAYDFLSRQANVDPSRVGIVGASYGSSLALIYAADNPKVKAVALLSPGLNYFGNMQTEPAVKKYGDRPLLLIAANDDKESADSVTKLKIAGANDRYEAKIYDKGGHGTALLKAGVGLDDQLDEFLTKSLGNK
jgi:dienelactone hydrolase